MAKYTFPNWQGIEFVNPTIEKVRIVLQPDYLNGTTVDCEVFFSEGTEIQGRLNVYLSDVPVNTFNGSNGGIEVHVWNYLNNPANGYLLPEQP